jgi:hypothetical protein
MLPKKHLSGAAKKRKRKHEDKFIESQKALYTSSFQFPYNAVRNDNYELGDFSNK